jgi:hypothetical protein
MMLKPTELAADFDQRRNAIGFWMRDGDNRLVRIFVMCDGLWRLDPSQVRDLATAFKQFYALRSHFERVVSDRHTRQQPYDGEYEGQPMMILRDNDIAPP